MQKFHICLQSHEFSAIQPICLLNKSDALFWKTVVACQETSYHHLQNNDIKKSLLHTTYTTFLAKWANRCIQN